MTDSLDPVNGNELVLCSKIVSGITFGMLAGMLTLRLVVT
jgi:hypothetical protein